MNPEAGNYTGDQPLFLRTPLARKRDVPFLHCYRMLDFGWMSASRLAMANHPFPVVPRSKDRWVFMAWLVLRHGGTYGENPAFAPVIEAWRIRHEADMRPTRDVIEAALISAGVTVAGVAARLGIDPDIVAAYESLFYNVLDRKEDHLFLRNVVYPNTRFEEMAKGYFDKADMGKLLLRLGYNKGLDEVLHFAGFRNGYGQGITSEQAASLFQQEVMVGGYLLLASGMSNFDRAHGTVSAARQVLQASKIGGESTSSTDQSSLLGDLLLDQLAEDSAWTKASIEKAIGVA